MSVALPKERFTLDEFLDWAGNQEEPFELVDGRIKAMTRDRVAHNRAKLRAAATLQGAIDRAGLDCESFVDGVGIGLEGRTYRLPDAAVQCGPIDNDALLLTNPIVVVEVVSPTSEERDVHAKLADYFAVPSIAHYLIVYDDKGLLVHHARDGDSVRTTFVREGQLTLDPPGLTVDVADFFAGETI